MPSKCGLAIRSEAVQARISPNITAMPTVDPQSDIVDMAPCPHPEDEHQLMLTAIKRAHARISLGPDAQIKQLTIDLIAGGKHRAEVAPIHEVKVHRAIDTTVGHLLHHCLQEAGEGR